MPLVDLNKVLLPAYKNSYAVGAFNIINLEFLQAILQAASNQKSSVIINIAEVHFEFIDVDLLCSIAKQLAINTDLNVVLHLDHGLGFNSIATAIRQGFSSVMFDGSSLTFEENIKQTKEITKMCHAAGVTVEAELGAVGGNEDGSLISEANTSLYTDAAQAENFVKQTGIDALAVAIGNSHGKYKGEPKLDFDLLKKIKNTTNIPLVLHGGSGISNEGFHKAISNGICKINFFTGMSQTAIQSLKNSLEQSKNQYNDFPLMLTKMQQDVMQTIEDQIKIFKNIS